MSLSVLIHVQKTSTRKIKKPASERRVAFSFLSKSIEITQGEFISSNITTRTDRV